MPPVWSKVEAHDEDDVSDLSDTRALQSVEISNHLRWDSVGDRHLRKDKDTSSMVITSRFDISISEKKDREDNGDDVPLGEDQPGRKRQSPSPVIHLHPLSDYHDCGS